MIALKFYADWCPLCKAMAPALMETEKQAAGTVLFVKLDQTDKASPQAEYMLAALGAGDLWKENAGKTGYILLLDPQSKRVVGRITSEMDAAAMTKAVSAGLSACGPGGDQPKADQPKSDHPKSDHPKSDHPK